MRQPALGDTVGGKYRLDSIIGRGGFATVYKASDTRIDRTVAVKVLTPGENGYPLTTVSRFQREARALASLNDPHTIRMFDYGRTDDGVLFMVFELLKGLDLSQHLSVVKTMSEGETVHVLEQLLYSLREAHAAGILHRDIKPGNIRIYEYMDDPLRAKLMDFGIVRLMDPEAESLTSTGYVVGTIRYMAPEQARGEELLPASDLFGLGLVAHEMLTGKQMPSMEVINSPLNVPVSQGFRRVLEKLLARDVQDRYQSANEVLQAISELPMIRGTSDFHDSEDNYATTREQSPQEIMAKFGGLERDAPAAANRAATDQAGNQPAADASASRVADPDQQSPTVSLPMVIGLTVLCFGVGLAAVVVLAGGGQDETAAVEQSRGTELSGLVKPEQGGIRVESIASKPVVDAGPPASETTPDAGTSASGCGKPADRLGDLRGLSLVSGLREDYWQTYVPKSYDPNRPHPLLIVFHSDASNVREALRGQKLRAFADEKGFLIIGPSKEGITAYRRGADAEGIRLMVEATRGDYCIDETRIFTLGVGGGGGGVESISCEPWVAATATTSWRYQKDMQMCEGKRPVPTLYFAQLKSKYLPVDGGRACAGYEVLIPLDEHEKRWRERNKCSGKEKTTKTYKGSECVTWDCDVPFVSCRIDGGHTWLGHTRKVDVIGCDGPPADFPHNETMWDFFESTADTRRPDDR